MSQNLSQKVVCLIETRRDTALLTTKTSFEVVIIPTSTYIHTHVIRQKPPQKVWSSAVFSGQKYDERGQKRPQRILFRGCAGVPTVSYMELVVRAPPPSILSDLP